MNNTSMNTDWARALGLVTPVVCAPMGGAAGGALAAAVSRAGALGMIGMGSAGSAALLEGELRAFRDAGGGAEPWGIGMVSWRVDLDPGMLDLALSARPTVLTVGFSDWERRPNPEWIRRAQGAGVSTIVQIATVREAEAAADAGVDAIVARGLEAGGHGDHQHTRDGLLDDVLTAVEVPVLAAGAIHSGAQVAALLGRGAAGAWVGTAFSATKESLTPESAKHALIAATGSDTVVTSVLDAALGHAWPKRFPERLLRTEFVAEWLGREDELRLNDAAKRELLAAVAANDFSVVPLDAGLGVDAIVTEQYAADVVAQLTPTYNSEL